MCAILPSACAISNACIMHLPYITWKQPGDSTISVKHAGEVSVMFFRFIKVSVYIDHSSRRGASLIKPCAIEEPPDVHVNHDQCQIRGYRFTNMQ